MATAALKAEIKALAERVRRLTRTDADDRQRGYWPDYHRDWVKGAEMLCRAVAPEQEALVFEALMAFVEGKKGFGGEWFIGNLWRWAEPEGRGFVPDVYPAGVIQGFLSGPDIWASCDCEDCGVKLPTLLGRQGAMTVFTPMIAPCPLCGGKVGESAWWRKHGGPWPHKTKEEYSARQREIMRQRGIK
jgi:hypothetical protein